MSQKTIHLTEEYQGEEPYTDSPPRTPRRLTSRIFLGSLRGALVLGSIIALGEGYLLARGEWANLLIIAKAEATETLRKAFPEATPQPPSEKTVRDLVWAIAQTEKVNPVILEALIERESGWKHDAIRFEPHVFQRMRGVTDGDKMLSSSHSFMQVMGYHYKTCGLSSWADLYEPTKNLRCGISILKANLKEVRGKDKGARLREALRRYNGSGPKAEAYADAVMGAIASKLLTSLGEGL